MDNTSVTISINRWTATSLALIAGGFVFVGGVFLATFDAASVFSSVRWTTIAAGLYACCAALYLVRPPVRLWVGLPILLFVSSSFLGAVFSTESMRLQSVHQSEIFGTVRSDISRAILFNSLSDSLLPGFRSFYESNDRHPFSIGNAFLKHHPTALVKVDMRPNKPFWDHTSIVPTEISDSAVVLVGYDKNSRGRDPGFVAVSGDTGIVQLRARLTDRGIDYDFEN